MSGHVLSSMSGCSTINPSKRQNVTTGHEEVRKHVFEMKHLKKKKHAMHVIIISIIKIHEKNDNESYTVRVFEYCS